MERECVSEWVESMSVAKNLFCMLEVLEFIQFAQGSPQNV